MIANKSATSSLPIARRQGPSQPRHVRTERVQVLNSSGGFRAELPSRHPQTRGDGTGLQR